MFNHKGIIMTDLEEKELYNRVKYIEDKLRYIEGLVDDMEDVLQRYIDHDGVMIHTIDDTFG